MTQFSAKLLKWSGFILISTVWISSFLFGMYILAFYASALYAGDMSRWNTVLPRLYEEGNYAATSGIGAHFAAGGIILILGSIQLIESIQGKYPALHRWIGRIYLVACMVAGVGGLLFIIQNGTIGGQTMNIGFGLYGILMIICVIETYRHAVARKLERHRAWALRLYALAIGSWLYRIDYGFWVILTDGIGHTKTFDGWFDQLMAFFFYLPNLLIAEIFIRAKRKTTYPFIRIVASLTLLLVTGFLILGTYYFTLYYWGPAILKWIGFL